ncbi:MAG: GxxExxY protein [Planctomycetaceae bacterium]
MESGSEVDASADRVIGAAIEVHRNLGTRYLESVDEETLKVEFEIPEVPFHRQLPIAVKYQGRSVGESRLGFMVGRVLIVELRAVDPLAGIHTAQVISDLKATGRHLGLLIDFNVPVLKNGIKRVVLI